MRYLLLTALYTYHMQLGLRVATVSLSLVGCLYFFSYTAHAATLYFDPVSATLNRGDAVTVAVRLDTDELSNECINAVDAVIEYGEGVVPVDVSTGRSIFSMWVEPPKINKEDRTITFAGGIPNGYCGRVAGDPRLTNVLAEIIFRSPGLQVGGGASDGKVVVGFSPLTTAYLNDGFGTKADIRTFSTEFELLPSIGSEIVDPWRDAIQADEFPPEPFSVELTYGMTAQGSKHYIVFNTTDKQSGLSHYEILEESIEEARWFSFGATTAPWVTVSGPVYILQDQSLRSVIRVKAVDKAGNEYIATLQPSSMSQNSSWLFVGIVTCIILCVVMVVVFGYRRYRNKKVYDAQTTDETII
jgi:hypothetical protein